ncbi:alanine racemase [Alphaproteobacteria bacterium]|nr:alanine racemase [Alphaproteobacteria bacterium]
MPKDDEDVLTTFASADNRIDIDLGAITHNWRYLDSLSPKSTITAAMVKADGYGLGAHHVGGALYRAGCRQLFVANLDEAASLRKHLDNINSTDAEIMVLHGCQRGQEHDMRSYRLTPVLNDLEQLSRWRLFAQNANETYPALLHLDTGMTRLGFDPDQTDWLIENKQALNGLDITYIMSHLVSGEIAEDPANASQKMLFDEHRSFFAGMKASLANSAGIFLGADFHYQMTRPGIAIYGVHPCDENSRKIEPDALKSTLAWHARIIQVRSAPAGATVGYGGTYQLSRPSRIATVGVGYADGYHRSLSNKAYVNVLGHRAPVIGRVSMDSITIDVTDIPADILLKAEMVALLSDLYSIDQMANDASTIPYEILTGISRRATRSYI